MTRRALITGATGFIGSELLRRLVAWTSDVEPILLVRAKGRQSARQRVDALIDELFGAAAPEAAARIRVVEGDLASERLGLDDAVYDDLASSITEVWHLGADVRFDQPLEESRRVHVEGTMRLAALAQDAVLYGQFTRFHHGSTYAVVRASGAGVIGEVPPMANASFRNSYEQTKAEAETALLRLVEVIPITIHRIGIVVGDSRTGWTPKFDVFYFPIRLLIDELDSGLARLRIPVLASARVNAVPVDVVADALFVLGQRRRGASGEIFHLLPGEAAPLVGATLQKGMRFFVDARIRNGMTVPPLPQIVPLEDVSLAHLANVLGEEVPAEVLDMIMQVMPYGFDASTWDNSRLLAALAGSSVHFAPIDQSLDAILDYPIRTGWGSVVEPRPPLPAPPRW